MTDKPKILIVDDKPENLFALSKLLQALDVEVGQALSGVEALNLTLEHDFCVAIVDIQMPEMDGYELVELLRSSEMTATLPVIFVSAIYSDEYHHRKGYEAGAVDFLSKPFVPEILLSKVQVFIDLYQQRQSLQDGASEPMHLADLLIYFETSPAVRLLRSTNAPFLLDFLERQFKKPGRISVPHSELQAALDLGRDGPLRSDVVDHLARHQLSVDIVDEPLGPDEDLVAVAAPVRVEDDMPAVRAIIREAAKNNHRMSSYILGVVNSAAFRMVKPAAGVQTTEVGSR